jgi:hypothetical protein
MKLLRQYIRELLLQEALHFDTTEELALLVHGDGYRTHYVLVNYHNAINWLETQFKDPDKYQDLLELSRRFVYSEKEPIVLGAVRTHRMYSQSHWAAAEVKLIGALDGWGPTMYDIVMGEEPNGIMADRDEVSRAAYRVWDYYRLHRDDVIKKPMDSLKNKWTSEDIDDSDPGSSGDYGSSSAESHEEFLADATSWVFDREPVPQAQVWKRNGQRIIDLLESQLDDRKVKYFFFNIVGETYSYYSGR